MDTIETVQPPSPPPPAQIWQDDSAAIPRERSLVTAWWIAVLSAITFIIGAAVLKPDPYAEILTFVSDGLIATFQMTIVSMTFSLILGLFAGLGRSSRVNWINTLASLYVEVIRGIPLLVQLFWIYYALSRFIQLGPQVSAVLGLTICYGAYIGETFRAGIQSIPKGQMEASRALGLSRTQSMRHVIVPQAIRIVLPPVGNEFIAMLKDSSLVSVLAISDLLRRGREYASRTFAYFATYTLVALIYLLVTLIFSRVVFYIEQGMSRQEEGTPITVMHRLAGSVVDLVVIDFLALPIWGLARTVLPEGTNAGPLILTMMGVLTIAYLLFSWTRIGRTPGMMAVGLRLIDRGGQNPTLSQAVKRLLIAFLPLPGLSYVGVLRPLGGYPLQDRFTQTFVVRN